MDIQPEKGGSGGTDITQGEEHWKRSEIKEFYVELAKMNGRYRGTPEREQEGRSIEKRIQEAAAKGNIIEDA